MKHQPINQVLASIDVDGETQRVGRLAWINRRVYFEYALDFLKSGLEISPFQLPLSTKTYVADPRPFDGLFGLFNDSLPDGWGKLLLDRKLRSLGIAPETLSPLDRLTHVGGFGMGAMLYEPDASESACPIDSLNLSQLAAETSQVLQGEADHVIPELLHLSGSSGGARPKVVVGVSHDKRKIIHGQQQLPEGYSHWIVKFAASHDTKDAGAIEFAYSLMARAAGIEIPRTHLFTAKGGQGYFAVERFDRKGNQRIHMHSLSGLIHSDHQLPSLDYRDAMNATLNLTRSMKEVTKIFQIAAFNACAHNRDDHAKNFAFLMDQRGSWKVSPAYDLTFSSGPGGEHCTTVMGEGKSPSRTHLEQLAFRFSLSKTNSSEILDRTYETIGKWPAFAEEAGVRTTSIRSIKKVILAT